MFPNSEYSSLSHLKAQEMSYRKVNISLRMWHLVVSGNTQPVTETWYQDGEWTTIGRWFRGRTAVFRHLISWLIDRRIGRRLDNSFRSFDHLPPAVRKPINHDPRISVGKPDWFCGIRADVFHLDKCVSIYQTYIYLMDEF
jgi:hypothetical protein